MPIRPELRQFYGRQWREEIRPRILKRAKDRCEICSKPDRKTVIVRFWGRRLWWKSQGGKYWRNHTGRRSNPPLVGIYATERRVNVVLTIAHLNHTPGDNRDENLAALCQWCHLHHDQQLHVQSARETRKDRKDAGRPLLQGAV
jgi:hypothetical protein